jgi:arylsulfatase
VRDSVPDWKPFELKKPPEGAPNVLIVLYDDTGLAAWSPYGGRINMPTMDRLADNGVTYTQWHTTALCSPTRSTFLTGRNHHVNRCASITEGSMGFPAPPAGCPPSARPSARCCRTTATRPCGWARTTTSRSRTSPRPGSRSEWPLSKGFDRFYGFLGGETNQWYPDLIEDNHAIEPPYTPEEGYHLSRTWPTRPSRCCRICGPRVRRSRGSWFCPGANHAHHSPQEYIDKYKGVFDDGYEAYREWCWPG